MEEKKTNNLNARELSNSRLENVSGGSWRITEENGRRAGLSLRKEDGSEGEWGYLWNSGDYYWCGRKVTDGEAEAIALFTALKGRQPNSVEEALEFDRLQQSDSWFEIWNQ